MADNVATMTGHASAEDEATETAKAKGAESTGEIKGGGTWSVFMTSEGPCLVVTPERGLRAKRRLPKNEHTATPALRAKFAAEAAPVVKRQLLADRDAKAKADAKAKKPDPKKVTFEDFSRTWVDGTLARLHPDVVEKRKSADTDAHRLKAINRLIGHVPLDDIGIEHANLVVQNMPKRCRSKASLRHYKGILFRVMKLAARPEIGLIARSPFYGIDGFLPKLGAKDRKALTWLFPDEEERLCTCTEIPLERRVLYAFLFREGMRSGEAFALQWKELDLERGLVVLADSKTGARDPWAVDPSVVRALAKWKAMTPAPKPPARKEDQRVFVDTTGVSVDEEKNAELFRADLKRAGLTRAQLFEASETRRPIRLHDTRSSFITTALACGWTETQVMAKSGHTTSAMLARYRRAKSAAQAVGIRWFTPMDEAIPEFREPKPAGPEGSDSGPVPPPEGSEASDPEGARGCTSPEDSGDHAAADSPSGDGGGFRFQWGNSCKGSSPFLRTVTPQFHRRSWGPRVTSG